MNIYIYIYVYIFIDIFKYTTHTHSFFHPRTDPGEIHTHRKRDALASLERDLYLCDRLALGRRGISKPRPHFGEWSK